MAILKDSKCGTQVEIWIDGKFVSSYAMFSFSENGRRMLGNMLEDARQFGREEARREIRESIGIRGA